MPEETGELTIPEILYAHFDPDLDEYVRRATAPIVMSIADEDGQLAAPALPIVPAAEQDGPEVRPLKAVPPSLRQSGTELTGRVVYWAAWGIPLLALAGAVAWRRRQAALERALAVSRRQNALRDARTALARAVTSGKDPRIASAEAVLSYLSARLATLVGGLTRETLLQRLREAGVPPDLERRLDDTLASGEAAGYTPLAILDHNNRDPAERAAQLLSELEEAIDA